ncbi:alpha/beta fold hydrolase [Pseudorhodoplanes sp.]|uniref:alpha/beta fold hydrolase n=1 Tax=Pseudorhodoplanes sp. TaxID=1934341 RepID=UPI003D0A2AB1
MDLRGHVSSEIPSPQSELSMERLVKDVAELLDHLGCKSVHIAGIRPAGTSLSTLP